MMVFLGPLLVISTAFAAWQVGCLIGTLLANRRSRDHELTASRRPSAATIAALQRDVDVPLDEYVRRHVDRELGLTPRRPMRPAKVCLTKNCQGETEEIYRWQDSHPTRVVHTCRRPT